MREWRDHPLEGVGEGNYQFDYYRERKTDRNLTEPHGLPFRLLAETGIVGFGLFLAFVVALAAALLSRWRRVDRDTAYLASGLAAAGIVVLGQSLIDWIWLLPGVMGLGLVALALAAASVSDPEPVAARPRPRLGVAIAVAGLVLAGVSVVLPYLADVRERRARGLAASAPARALSEARAAASLDPLSVDPLYIEAGSLESLGRRKEAQAKLQQALRKDPDNFGTLGVLGDFEVRAGDAARARAYYQRALALNPLDVGLQKLARSAGSAP
jgi:O-antigen ligase